MSNTWQMWWKQCRDMTVRYRDEKQWWWWVMRMKMLRFVVEVDVAPQSTSELRFIDWTWTTTSHHPHFTSSDRPCQEPDLTDTQMFIIRNKCLLLVVINGSWRLHRLNSVDVQSRSTDCFAMLHCFMSAAYNSAADTNCSVPVTYCCIHPFSVGLL